MNAIFITFHHSLVLQTQNKRAAKEHKSQLCQTTMNHQILFCALLLAAAPWASLAQTTFTVVANSPIAQDASYGMSWVDYDNDGFIDLHSCGLVRNLLYHNDGGVSFSRIGSTNAIVARTYPPDYAEAGYWADYDNDGLTDVIIP